MHPLPNQFIITKTAGGILFKQHSLNNMYFDKALTPGVHYLEFWKGDMHGPQDLLPQLMWARQHPEEAARIAENARDFAATHMTNKGRACYLLEVWWAMKRRMRYVPSIDKRRTNETMPLRDVFFTKEGHIRLNRKVKQRRVPRALIEELLGPGWFDLEKKNGWCC
jgi:hypothetical protein